MSEAHHFGRLGHTALALAVAVGLMLAGVAMAAPKAELWDRWAAHDPASGATIDHSAWARFLSAYVSRDAHGVNRVAYGRVTAADRAMVERYLERLSTVPISRYTRDEQIAYWINLYNALTVKLVLDRYPIDSIRDIDISPGLFADGPWERKLATVEGVGLSLDDIEHRILRPIWQDPRIHYVVNCAAVGCPNLMDRAFTGARWDEMMDAAARDYVNNWRGVRFDDGELIVSKLYVWYTEDFGGSESAVLDHLRRYAEPGLRGRLEDRERIDAYAYDWGLNDLPPGS